MIIFELETSEKRRQLKHTNYWTQRISQVKNCNTIRKKNSAK